MKVGLRRAGSRSPLFYGWVVVAGAFIIMGVGFGAAYAFAAFFGAIQ